MAREDLNPVEEARACAALTEELGLSREEVGRRVGRSRVAVSNLIRLLDLPDEALELIQAGDLSEGHGRALLLAPDHGDRRRLARAAAQNGWSVRETEQRARGARQAGDEGTTVRAHRRRASALHPDQEAAIAEIGDSLEAALGRDVKVSASGPGFRAQLEFGSAEEALEFARSLKLRPPASTGT
jgi:ParB family chromosome partitioning protein